MSYNKKKSKKKLDDYKDDFTVEENDDSCIITLSEGEPIFEGEILRSFSFDDINGFVETLPNSTVPLKPPVAASAPNPTLSFNPSTAASDLTYEKETPKSSNENVILYEKTSKANQYGRTPPIDGEVFDMIRTYTLRRSTVRILSKIKVIHLDDNVYLNTIIDEAIRYYYDYLKNNLKE